MKLLNPKYLIAIFSILLSVTKTNAQWSVLGTKTDTTFKNRAISSVITDVNGNVYAASHDFTYLNRKSYVNKWNGTQWILLGDTTIFNNIVKEIAVDASGNVYAGGYFTNSSGNRYVAKWNGKEWSELGKNVYTFNSLINTVITDNKGNVYAAGAFYNNSGTIGKMYVAKWDGISWSELGGKNTSTFNSFIHKITSDANGNIYAAGYFSNENGYTYVAKWNGKEWSELGGKNTSTFIGPFYSIDTDANENVFASGLINNKNFINYIAKWNGAEWSELGGDTDTTIFHQGNSVSSIATDAKGNIYVGDYHIPFWNGTAWGKLDGGDTSGVSFISGNVVTTDVNGTVYSSGVFKNDINKYYVAKYTPSTLPIKLASINAIQENKTIRSTWQTSTELNTSHFIIQHSIDGNSFKDIGTVKAIGSGGNGYQFTDNNPVSGINYYRLKSVDKDGASTYSKVISVEIVDSRYKIVVAPNPVKDKVTVVGSHVASIQVIDNLGRVIKTQTFKDATNPILSVGGLKVGAYQLRVQTTDGKVSGVGLVKE